MSRDDGGFGWITSIILGIVGLVIAAYLLGSLLPVVVDPIFASSNSLYSAFKDIWNKSLGYLIGTSNASTVSPYIAIGSLIVLAVALTFGVVSWVRRRIPVV